MSTSLERIRSKAGLLIAVIGIALFSFIIGDFLNSGATFFQQSKEVVAKVNGTKISIQEYEKKVNELTEVYQIQLGQTSLTEENTQQIREAVFESMVREEIFADVFDQSGIEVGSKELLDLVQGENISPMIQNIPFFRNPQTGQFEKAAIVNFIQAINAPATEGQDPEMQQQVQQFKKYWLFWENAIQSQRKEEKFNNLMSRLVSPNKLDAQTAYDASANTSDVLFVAQSYASMPDSLFKVSDAELKAAYNAKKEMFKSNEVRQIKYIVSRIMPSDADIKEATDQLAKVQNQFATTDDVAEIVNQNSDEPFVNAFVSVRSLSPQVKAYVEAAGVGSTSGIMRQGNTFRMVKVMAMSTGADSVKLRQINVQDPAKSDSLMKVVTAAGADFAAIANQVSGANNGGEIGWITEESAVVQLGEDFKDKIFAVTVKTPFVFKSKFGTHIFEVTEKTNATAKVKLAQIVMDVTPSSRTYSEIYNKLSTEIGANSSFDKFAKIAPETGYSVMTNDFLTANEQSIDNVKGSRTAIHWAYNADKGDVSKIFECENALVVVALGGIKEKGYAPIEDAKPMLMPELIAKKKGEKIIADLKSKNPSSLQAYAQAMNLGRVDTAKFVSLASSRATGIGFEPEVVGAILTAQKGQLSQPVIGKSGVYVFDVFNQTKDARPFDLKSEIAMLKNDMMYRLMYQSYQVLRDQADVTDLRYKFY